jgi:hypothetical protein
MGTKAICSQNVKEILVQLNEKLADQEHVDKS